MCGLAGILLFPTERPETVWQDIRQLFTQTLIFNQERGQEASGVVLIQRDGTFRLFKQPVPALELVEAEAYRAVMTAVGPETTCLLGHTRMPTKGSRWDNANNHPLLAGQVIGIHNGHIHNDDDLFFHLALPRQGLVDSEVIFRLLDTVSPLDLNGTLWAAPQDKAYLAATRHQIALLQGRFATLSVDLRRAGWLLAFKNEMPLCMHYHAPWQALCFSSRYLFLRKAFGRAVITEALPTRRAYLFDAERLPEMGRQPIDSLPLETRHVNPSTVTGSNSVRRPSKLGCTIHTCSTTAHVFSSPNAVSPNGVRQKAEGRF